ncbi:hypothetical protein KIW84_023236, partial [Lathyrus oleraceus]
INMSPTLNIVHISLVLLLVVSSEAGLFPRTVHLEVTNRLSNNKQLILHCYERNGEDLREYLLFPGGQFIYAFKPRKYFFTSSKYYCRVKKSGSDLKWFVLWSQGRDGDAGRFIKWTLTDSKACRLGFTISESLCVFYNK